MSDFSVSGPYASWDFYIARGSDWNDELPQFTDANDDVIHYTGRNIELFVRPAFDSPSPALYLTSSGSAGIVINDAVNGLATIDVAMATVDGDLEAGEYRWFLRLLSGTEREHLARGRVFVLPGEDSTS